MALRIDTQEGALGSLDDMRVRVEFRLVAGLEVVTLPDTHSLSDKPWVADSLGDIPVVGDYLLLPVPDTDGNRAGTGGPGYKVAGRHIDFGPFVNEGQRIICTVLLETEPV